MLQMPANPQTRPFFKTEATTICEYRVKSISALSAHLAVKVLFIVYPYRPGSSRNVRKAYFDRRTSQSEFCFETYKPHLH